MSRCGNGSACCPSRPPVRPEILHFSPPTARGRTMATPTQPCSTHPPPPFSTTTLFPTVRRPTRSAAPTPSGCSVLPGDHFSRVSDVIDYLASAAAGTGDFAPLSTTAVDPDLALAPPPKPLLPAAEDSATVKIRPGVGGSSGVAHELIWRTRARHSARRRSSEKFLGERDGGLDDAVLAQGAHWSPAGGGVVGGVDGRDGSGGGGGEDASAASRACRSDERKHQQARPDAARDGMNRLDNRCRRRGRGRRGVLGPSE